MLLYATRHGETEWNTQRRMQGHKDSPLTALGRQQAGWLGNALAEVNFEVIYCSTSGRARQTAEIIAAGRDIPIIYTDALKEIGLGQWEGMRVEEVEQMEPVQIHNFWEHPHLYVPGAGESFQDVVDRARQLLQSVIEKGHRRPVLLVCHAVIMKALSAVIENKALSDLWSGPYMKSTCLNAFEYDETNGKWTVVLSGDTSHLPQNG